LKKPAFRVRTLQRDNRLLRDCWWDGKADQFGAQSQRSGSPFWRPATRVVPRFKNRP